MKELLKDRPQAMAYYEEVLERKRERARKELAEDRKPPPLLSAACAFR